MAAPVIAAVAGGGGGGAAAAVGGAGGTGGVLSQMSVMISEKGAADTTKSLGGLGEKFGSVFGGINDKLKDTTGKLQESAKEFQGSTIAALGFIMIMARASAYVGAYMEELMDIFGYFGDILMDAVAPIMDQFLDILWQLADWFEKQPEAVKQFIGVLMMVGLLMPILITLFASLLAFMSPVGAAVVAIAAAIMLMYQAWLLMQPYIEEWSKEGGCIYNLRVAFDKLKEAAGPLIKAIEMIATTTFAAFLKDIVIPVLYMTIMGVTELVKAVTWLLNPFQQAQKGIDDTTKSVSGLTSVWNTLTGAMDWAYKNIVKPIIDGFAWFASVIGSIKNPFEGWKLPDLSSWKPFGDVIWRAGEQPIAISPDDNVIAFKGDTPPGGGGRGGGNITVNVYVDKPMVTSGSMLDELVERTSRAVSAELRRYSA